MLRRLGFRLIPAALVAFTLAGACSSTTKKATYGGDAGAPNNADSGAAGEAQAGSAGDTARAGSAGDSVGGEAGTAGEPNVGGSGGLSPAGGTGGMSDNAGAPSSAGGSSAGAGGAPQMVTAYGCFGRSGDGLDVLDDGSPAVLLNGNAPYTAPCGMAWVSDNANAFAPQTPPTTIVMRRRFIVAPSILQSGTFTISYKVDDGVSFILNGHAIASCMPTSDNAGFCQQACGSTQVPTDTLLGDGQVNTLEIHLINLQSIPAGDTNFGYTAASYQMCVGAPT
jgi:hypothetical protein